MPLIPIDSLEDPRLDAYVRLTDTQLRSRLEPEKGVFIAESHKVIERAFNAGEQPLSLLLEHKWLEPLEPLIGRMEQADPQLPVFVGSHQLLEQITGYEVTRGALAAFRRQPPKPLEQVLDGARLVAVLENITNHTNVGAIFRSAAALGVDAVLVTPSCYDPLYRRAARVSMGTVFQIPWTRIGEEEHPWPEAGLEQLRQAGFTTVAMALEEDSLTLDDPRITQAPRVALVFGTEGDGLSRTTIAACDHTVCIPMAHGVDSLNVAAASAVAFYALRR